MAATTTAVEAVEEECAEVAEEAAEEVEVDLEEIAKETTDKVATTKVATEAMMTPEEATTTTIEDHNQATKAAVVEATVSATSHRSLWLLCQQTQRKPNLKKRSSKQISSK